MTATIVNVQDPVTLYNMGVDSNGRIGINNWPGVQVVSGTVNVAFFPDTQVVSGSVDVTNRSSRILGNVVVTSGGVGTNTAPAYNIIQDPSNNAHKMAVNSDGSINISGSISATNPSVDATGSAVPTDATYLGANKGGNLTGLSLDGSGYLYVNVAAGGGSGGTSSSYGSAFPATGTAIGASDGTNMQALLVESSSNKNLRVALYNGSNEASVSAGGAVKVDNSAVTQPISAASLPLPGGAATAAKQPALGTAGSASTDVITVQGIASMTALKVDGSAVTQPVSGTVSAAQSGTWTVQPGNTANTTPWLATISQGGNSATVTGSNALKVDGSAVTQPVSGTVTANQGGSWSATVTQGTASNLNAQVVGAVASAGSNSGNPVKVGGPFNTTQPTVTNGQMVDAQYTARGAAIVATGVDTFSVTANAGTNLNTSLLALESGGNLATIATRTPALGQTTSSGSSPVVIASDQSNLPMNLKQVSGSNIATGNNAVPVLMSAATGYVSAYGSNAAALTSNTDYTFNWGGGGNTQVNHLMVQNNSSIAINWDLDTATSAGSPTLSNTAGMNTLFLDVQTTTLHLRGTGTPNVNGTSASNIVVRGWL